MVVRQTGIIFVRRSATSNAILCHSCGTAMFRQAQAHNLSFGWWGLISFLTNFVTLAGNFNRYRQHRLIGSSAEMPLRPALNPGRPLWQRPQMIVPVAFVAMFVAVGVASVGREQVRQLQAGQCIYVPSAGHFSDVKLVPCAQPHGAEVAGVIKAADSSSATDTGKVCAQLAAENVLLSKAEDVELHALEHVAGAGRSAQSEIRAVCILSGLNDSKLTGRVTG